MISNGNTPGEGDKAGFYDAAPLEPHLLYQGEILIDVPILNMPKETRWLLLRTRSGKMVNEALENGTLGGLVKVLDSNQSKQEWYNATEGDFAMARLTKRPVVVLSQTCDIQTKQFIQVAPIFEATGTLEHLERLVLGQILSAFWLEARPPHLSDSYADLELIQAVHVSFIRRLSPNQHFRLAPARVRELQRFITRYFGRPNSFDAGADRVPHSGTYLCVQCFYMNGEVTSVVRTGGEGFERCDKCGGRGWILRGH